ncbi:TPA: hypothetical protein ACH98K_002570 [Staphylococcus aureus]
MYKITNLKQEFEVCGDELVKVTDGEELYQLVNEKLDLANCNREHLVMAGFNSQMEVMCLYVVRLQEQY